MELVLSQIHGTSYHLPLPLGYLPLCRLGHTGEPGVRVLLACWSGGQGSPRMSVPSVHPGLCQSPDMKCSRNQTRVPMCAEECSIIQLLLPEKKRTKSLRVL